MVRAYLRETTSGVSISDSQTSQSIENATYSKELRYSIHVNPSNNNALEEFNTKLNLVVENGYYQTLGPQKFNPAFTNFGVKPCLYGFELCDSKCKCLEALNSWLDGISCNIQSQSYTRPEKAQWWMGFKNNSILLVSQYCPFDYCCQDCKRTIYRIPAVEITKMPIMNVHLKELGLCVGNALLILVIVLQSVKTVNLTLLQKLWRYHYYLDLQDLFCLFWLVS